MDYRQQLWELCRDEGLMVTPRGLVICKPAKFEPANYKGLNKFKPNSKHVALKPTNLGDPNKKR